MEQHRTGLGEIIDPLAAGKQGFFFVWKQRFGLCLLLILYK